MGQDLIVDVTGIPEEFRPRAEEDIRRVASIAAAFAERLELPFLLHEARLTRRFEDDVNEFSLRKYGVSGSYSARRDNVQAFGKTIWVHSQEGSIRFVVLVDADFVSPWSLNNPWCLVGLLHEFGHVVLEARTIRRLGKERYAEIENTRERYLDDLSTSLIDEYQVDLFVDAIVRVFCKKADGEPWSLRELEEARGLDWVGTHMAALKEMPHRIDDIVRNYRFGNANLEEMFKRVHTIVKDLLILFSHTCAMYFGTDSWPGIIEEFEKTEASQRFLADNLNKILDALVNSELPFEAAVQTVAHAIENIYRRCGLTFENTSEGMYIAVG